MSAEEVLKKYGRFSISLRPANHLSGDIDKRDGEINLIGKKGDGLNGSISRRLLSVLNFYFRENPLDVDDTRLVFEANEAGSDYSEKKDGTAKLVLKISIGLAQSKPGSCGCC